MDSDMGPAGFWQQHLQTYCNQRNMSQPVFQIVSDRRGGRTAWSSRVTIDRTTLSARYWYDGKNLQNAREDAAELAVTWLNQSQSSPTSSYGW